MVSLWSFLTLAACGVIAVRLLTYRRGPAPHRHAYAWAAWGLASGASALAVTIGTGRCPPPGPLEAFAAVALAAALVAHRGDLARLIQTLWKGPI